MAESKEHKRDIGTEILKGIRELKRGEVGRVVTFSPVAETRARGVLPPGRPARFSQSPTRTYKSSWRLIYYFRESACGTKLSGSPPGHQCPGYTGDAG